MKWKESGEMQDPVEKTNQENFFDEEQYSPWSPGKNPIKTDRLNRSTIFLGLLGFAVASSIAALLMLLFGGQGESPDKWQLNLLQERIVQLEERLSKYDAIDEKVTRIWEQASSFEKFKERFERGEASMSSRMDNITTNLDNLQKRAQATSQPRLPVVSPPVQRAASDAYHGVAAGDTLYSISKLYGIELDDLLKLNGLEKNSILRIGQKLVVKAGPSQ